MPSVLELAPIALMCLKKAARSCQSRELRNVMTAGRRKSLLSLQSKTMTAGRRKSLLSLQSKTMTAGRRKSLFSLQSKTMTAGRRKSLLSLQSKTMTAGRRKSLLSLQSKKMTTGGWQEQLPGGKKAWLLLGPWMPLHTSHHDFAHHRQTTDAGEQLSTPLPDVTVARTNAGQDGCRSAAQASWQHADHEEQHAPAQTHEQLVFCAPPPRETHLLPMKAARVWM